MSEVISIIDGILNDQEKRNIQIDLGFKHAQNFNDQIIAKKLISTYRNL